MKSRPKIISTDLEAGSLTVSHPNPLGLSTEELALIESERVEFADLAEFCEKFIDITFEIKMYKHEGSILRGMIMQDIKSRSERVEDEARTAYDTYNNEVQEWRELKTIVEVDAALALNEPEPETVVSAPEPEPEPEPEPTPTEPTL
jgi:hypothetical protein